MTNVANAPKRTGKISDQEKEEIIAVFKKTDSVNETARRTGRSSASVSRILNAGGFEPSKRSQTKAMNEANAEDAKARRARLADKWRRVEEQTLDLAMNENSRYHLVKGTGSGRIIDKVVTSVPADDRKHLLTGAAIASDKAAILERIDAPKDGQGRGLLEDLVSTLHKERGE